MLCWLWFSAFFLWGIGLAFLFEHLDDTLKRSEEMELVLGLPTLGLIPFSPNKALPRADSLALIGDSQALLPSPDQRAA
jgi:hypothetical protein